MLTYFILFCIFRKTTCILEKELIFSCVQGKYSQLNSLSSHKETSKAGFQKQESMERR